MPNYFYTAKSLNGDTKTGILQAQNEYQVAQVLKEEGLILIKAVSNDTKRKSIFNFRFSFSKVSSSEKIMLVKNLGVMFSTGLSLVKSFDILSSQTKSKKLKSTLLDIKERVNKGENLSDAMNKYPSIFPELFVNMVKVGEESGTLDEIFQILSLQLTKEHELKSKIRNAMVYPILILIVMIVVGAVIITFVLPSLKIFFSSLNIDIPLSTKIVLDVGDFLLLQWHLVFLSILLFVICFWLILKTNIGKKIMDTFLLKLPILSPIIKKNNSAFLVRSLSSLITAGISLNRSLEITAKTAHNHYFKEALIEARKKIEKGEKLSNALKSYQNIFPFGVVEMVEVGEETGKTSDILKKLADFYEQEAIIAIEKLAVLIEPLLIIILGLAVGFFAFSIIQPMYSSLRFISQ